MPFFFLVVFVILVGCDFYCWFWVGVVGVVGIVGVFGVVGVFIVRVIVVVLLLLSLLLLFFHSLFLILVVAFELVVVRCCHCSCCLCFGWLLIVVRFPDCCLGCLRLFLWLYWQLGSLLVDIVVMRVVMLVFVVVVPVFVEVHFCSAVSCLIVQRSLSYTLFLAFCCYSTTPVDTSLNYGRLSSVACPVEAPKDTASVTA